MVENCQEEYAKLKTEYLDLKQDFENTKQDLENKHKELEEKNQELYERERNIKVLQSLQIDYKNEIDMLQSEEIRQKQKYQDIIKHLEQQINTIRDGHNDEKQALENVIMKMEEKNEFLRTELEVYKVSDGNTTNFVGDTSSLINDILSEPPEFYENEQLKNTIKELQETNEVLERKVEEYANEIENLKESYKLVKEDLQEANSNNQFLNDEIMGLKVEVDSLKNQPLNKDSRGNSLFAEVDDRRVYLQDKINKMKAAHIKMTQDKAYLENTVRQLKLENMRLLEKWKFDVEEKDDDQDEVGVALRSRVKTLEELIEQYKRDLEAKPLVISKRNFDEVEFYSMTLKQKSKQIQDLRDEMSSKSLDRFLLSTALRKANEEKRKWHLEALNKQHQLDILQLKKSACSSDNNNEKSSSISNEKTENNSYNPVGEIEKKDIKKESTQNITKERGSSSKIVTQRLSDIKEEIGNLDFLKDTAGVDKEYIIDDADETSSINQNITIADNKENIANNPVTTETKKVTFSENTLSPKKTGVRGGRRIFVPKPILFK